MVCTHYYSGCGMTAAATTVLGCGHSQVRKIINMAAIKNLFGYKAKFFLVFLFLFLASLFVCLSVPFLVENLTLARA